MRYVRGYLKQNPAIGVSLKLIDVVFADRYWSMDELTPYRIDIPKRHLKAMCSRGVINRRRISPEEIGDGRLRTRKVAWKYYRLSDKVREVLVGC